RSTEVNTLNYSPENESHGGQNTERKLNLMRNRHITFTTIFLTLGCLAPSPKAHAVSPAPDGGYAGNNTAEGTQALQSLSGGVDNTALGFQALFHNTTGNSNTAEGFRALFANTNGDQNTAT